MIDITKDEDLDYEFKYGTINYRISDGDECLIEYDSSDNKVCFIDFISIVEDSRKEGFGEKYLKKFIKKMKKAGIKKFYLFAAFQEEDLGLTDSSDEYKLEVFNKIIKMYEKCGFESYGPASSWSDQIDMAI